MGEYHEAERHLEKAAALNGHRSPVDCLFTAMVLFRLGRRDEARRWLAKGRETIDLLLEPDFPQPPTWTDRAKSIVLRRGAEALINHSKRGEVEVPERVSRPVIPAPGTRRIAPQNPTATARRRW